MSPPDQQAQGLQKSPYQCEFQIQSRLQTSQQVMCENLLAATASNVDDMAQAFVIAMGSP
jgi:hypothetical protein